MNQYTILPFEIVYLIVKHIPPTEYYHCALVNTQFYSAVNPQLWRKIKIRKRQSALRFLDSVIEAKNPVGGYIRLLTLDAIYWRDSLFLRLVKHLGGLKELCIPNGQGLTYRSLQQLPQNCPRLTELSLGRYHLTQLSLDMLFTHYPRLRVLELLDCTSDNALELAPGHAASYSLQKLTIHSSINEADEDNNNNNGGGEDDDDEDNIENGDDDHMVGGNAMDLTGFSLLTHLDLLGNTFTPRRLSFFTTPTAVHCPLLQYIHLCDDFQLDRDQLIHFVTSHPRLKIFGLEQGLCTDHVLDSIAASCPDIVMIRIPFNPSITPIGIRHLIQKCRFLVILDITYCAIEGYHFPELNERYTNIAGNLHLLDLRAMDAIRHRPFNMISDIYNQGTTN